MKMRVGRGLRKSNGYFRVGRNNSSFLRMRKKTGDTLVEVVLAMAIFSMVGVAAVAVISASSSSAQAALETTITREVVDEQAELLRYIHNSVLVGMRSDTLYNNKYRDIWQQIIANAVEDDYDNTTIKSFINNYGNLSSCGEIYSSYILSKVGAFILNPRAIYLGDYGGDWTESMAVDQVVKSYDANESTFQSSVTSPRLIYGNSSNNNFSESLYEMNGRGNELSRAEGIFVFAVRDQGTTSLVQTSPGKNDTSIKTEGQAFYDFYIRSCWFGPSADRPSTISTLVRLVDPTEIGTATGERHSSAIFNVNGDDNEYYSNGPGSEYYKITKQYSWLYNHSNAIFVSSPTQIPKKKGNYEFIGYTRKEGGYIVPLNGNAEEYRERYGLAASYDYLAQAFSSPYINVCDMGKDCTVQNFYAAWQEVEFKREPSEAR